MITITRRRFLALTGGLIATGCTSRSPGSLGSVATTGPAPITTPTTTTVPGVVTTVSTPAELVPDDRVIVMVQLAGGNDAVNTLPPTAGAYHDLRPTLALPESDVLAAPGFPGHSLHPALAPLLPFTGTGRLAAIAGVGFPDPDRSHFVSTDRWLRADRMDDTLGWLGRWLDSLPDDLTALGATSLGGGGGLLLGADRRGTAIDQADAFAFPDGIGNASIRGLTEPLSDEPLLAAAQRGLLAAIGAVAEFDAVADAVRDELPELSGDGLSPCGGTFSTGLAIAAQLVVGDVGARVVTVHGSGFDTHSAQLATHAGLLADLAAGLASFWDTVDEAGIGDRVLLATHSEFGRRVRENASEGCDHGAAGVSFLMGNPVHPGLHGSIDLSDLLDGDLRPVIDPRTLFTACLDWLGADVERILGDRWDDVALIA